MTNEQKNYMYEGRRKIYTPYDDIDETNVLEVLSKTKIIHDQNVNQMDFLYKFEQGDQPLMRKKVFRPDIDIVDISNIANYITEFKLGYNWGNPITFIKRKDSNLETEHGVTELNGMLDLEGWKTKQVRLLRDMEITGLGYAYVDIKRNASEDDSLFDLNIIDPRYCYVVHKNNVSETPIMNVLFRVKENGEATYYCYTKDKFFKIVNLLKIVNNQKTFSLEVQGSGEINLLGELPLIEFTRNPDRMGCFERELDALRTINTMESDFADAISQDCQSIWWGNDVEFEKDSSGNTVKPESNQWLLTQTTASGKSPIIQSLINKFDYSGALDKIRYSANMCLTRCFVPVLTDLNGGSSGTAMSMSSGWSQAETQAEKQELIIQKPLTQLLKLVLKVIKSRTTDANLKELNIKDLEAKICRKRTYDLNTKINAVCALLSKGFELKDALTMCDTNGDIAQIVENSGESVAKWQEAQLFNTNDMGTGMQDNSSQSERSPYIDGLETKKD